MSQSARVHSLDALKALHAALAQYGPDALAALGAADIEIRRTFEYLHNQLKHWQRQVDRRHEDVNRARSDLVHARTVRQGEHRGCVEQEIALRKAQNRLREAEAKVVVAKRWILQLPQAINEFDGPARRLGGFLDANLKHGLAILNTKIDVLEAYMAVQTNEPPAAPGGSS